MGQKQWKEAVSKALYAPTALIYKHTLTQRINGKHYNVMSNISERRKWLYVGNNNHVTLFPDQHS